MGALGMVMDCVLGIVLELHWGCSGVALGAVLDHALQVVLEVHWGYTVAALRFILGPLRGALVVTLEGHTGVRWGCLRVDARVPLTSVLGLHWGLRKPCNSISASPRQLHIHVCMGQGRPRHVYVLYSAQAWQELAGSALSKAWCNVCCCNIERRGCGSSSR